MDPLTAIAAANSANTALRTVTATARAAWRRLRLSGQFDPEWIDLGLPDTGDASYGADEINDIYAFLASERMRPFLSFLAVALLTPQADERVELISLGRSLFDNEAGRWTIDSRNEWHKKSQVLWLRLTNLLQGSLPSIKQESEVAADLQEYAAFIASPLLGQSEAASNTSSFLTRLIGMAQDVGRLYGATVTAAEVAQQMLAAGHEPMFTHAESDVSADFRELYVERKIEEIDTGEVFDAERFTSSGQPFRAVLIGNPGAEKTTFIRHLMVSLVSPTVRDPVVPTILVRCRDYISKGWATSISAYARTSLNADLSLDVTSEEFDAVLLLGKAAVIFDGLDKITDSTQRKHSASARSVVVMRVPVTACY